jgi:hypothetical protein
MWLVLAHSWDAAARALVDRRLDHLALVTPADVRGHGWSLSAGTGGSSVTWDGAVAGGGRVGGIRGAAFDGVVTRIDGVGVADLPHIHASDRHYAAAELGAFLLAWLDACSAPVVNRPSPGCLSGPPWSPARWRLAAHEAGLALAGAAHPARPDGGQQDAGHQDAGHQDAGQPGGACVLTVIGDRVLGAADPQLALGARRLAAVAGTYLLGVTFDGCAPDGDRGAARFVSATPCPELNAHAESVLAASLGWPPC